MLSTNHSPDSRVALLATTDPATAIFALAVKIWLNFPPESRKNSPSGLLRTSVTSLNNGNDQCGQSELGLELAWSAVNLSWEVTAEMGGGQGVTGWPSSRPSQAPSSFPTWTFLLGKARLRRY